jgi:glycosyltransferase involved in cell wall biosynthesis
VASALSLLPESMKVIPVVHNDEEWVYRVASANWKAWDVAVGVSKRVTEVMNACVPQRETRTILNGVELPEKEDLHQRRTGEFKMLFVGRLTHGQKGVLFLPQILARVRAQGIDATLTVIGDGPDQEELHRHFKESCPTGSFVIVPPQTGDSVYDSMISHHVLIVPSFYEGLGVVALEAQACGCVPIASMLPGVTDISIADGKTGLLCSVGDVAGFAAQSVRLASDRLLWQEMSVAGQKRIAEGFTTEIMASKYIELFEEARRGHFARGNKRFRVPIDFSIYGWRGVVPNRLRRLRDSLEVFGQDSIQPSGG